MLYGRSDLFCYLVLTVLFLSPLSLAGDDKKLPKQCDPSDAGQKSCGENERCVKKSDKDGDAWCQCYRNFTLIKGVCVQMPTVAPVNATTNKPEMKTDSGGGSVAAGLLVPTFLIGIAVLLYFGARRYKWLQRFRQFRQNRYGNVLVTRDDDVDDDPPIA